MALVSGNTEVPGGQIGSGLAQVVDNRQTLAYLDAARKRQDLINWHNEQARLKQEALVAAAKKKAEDDAVVAEYKTGKGYDFHEAVAPAVDDIINQTKVIVSDNTLPKAVKENAVKEGNRKIEAINAWALTQKERLDAADKDAEYYSLNPNRRAFLGGLAKSDKNFYMKDFSEDYRKQVFDPYNFNANKAGSDLLLKIGEQKVKTKDESGRIVEKTWDAIINEPQILGRRTLPPTLNRTQAEKLISGNPVVDTWYKDYVIKRQAEQLENNPNLTPNQAATNAENEAMDKLFSGKAKVSAYVDNESTYGRKSSENKADKLLDFDVDPNTIERVVTYNAKGGEHRSIKGSFGPSDSYSLRKGAVDLGANKNVFLMNVPVGRWEDIQEENPKTGQFVTTGKEYIAPKLPGFTKNSDGSYQMNFGGSTRSWERLRRPVYILTKDTPVKMKNGETIIRPAGTPLPLEEGAKYPNSVRKVDAYIVSPKQMQIVDEDKDIEMSFKTPSLSKMEVVIPIDQANEFSSFEKNNKRSEW